MDAAWAMGLAVIAADFIYWSVTVC